MIFTNLKLKNFKSYLNTDINLGSGITIIVGENGAGKSTILEAISFALFKQHTSRKIDDLIRINKNKQANQTMAVQLEFISNGITYRVSREKTKSSSKAHLYQKVNNPNTNDFTFSPLCTGDKEVSNEIKNILQMDGDLFLNAIYVRQGEIADLVAKTPSEKKQLIGRLLGIESLEKAWRNILPLINLYKEKKAELKGQLSSDEGLKNKFNIKKAELENLRDKANNLTSKLQMVNNEKEEMAKYKQDLENSRETYLKLNQDKENEEKNLLKLQEEKREVQNKLDDIYKQEEEIKRLEKYVLKLPLYTSFQKSILKVESLKAQEKELNSTAESIKKYQSILEEEKYNYDIYLQYDDKIESLEKRKSLLEKDLEDLARLEDEQKTLTSQIQNDTTKLEGFLSQIKHNLSSMSDEKELDNIEDFHDLSYFISKLKTQIEQTLLELDESIIQSQKDITTFKEGIKAAEKPLKELESVENKCPICQSEIGFKKKEDLVKSYEDIIENNNITIKEWEYNLEKYNNDKIDCKNKLDSLSSLENEISAHVHIFDNIKSNKDKLPGINEKIEDKSDSSRKLGELLTTIKLEKNKREDGRESYENYLQAQGALKQLPYESEIQNKIIQNNRDVDDEICQIKLAVNKDSHLDTNMTEDELDLRINDLKEKERKYNQLKGYVKIKRSLEAQAVSRREDIDWKINRLDKIKNDLKLLDYNPDSYDRVKIIYDRSFTQSNKIKNELNLLKGQATELIASIEDLSVRMDKFASLQKEYDDVDDFTNLLVDIRKTYSKDGIQEILRNRSRPTIQKFTKEFFEEFKFNYSDLILDENYDVSLYGPEGETSLEMLSGGEKIAIALALRLGITQAMSGASLETILLDEPTIHLDSYRRHELIDLLREMSFLPQMIIVTHDVELEHAADHIIKIEKVNGVSNIEVGVEIEE